MQGHNVIMQINELQWCDEDIAEEFRKHSSWFIGTPTMVQLVREIRKLTEAINNSGQCEDKRATVHFKMDSKE